MQHSFYRFPGIESDYSFLLQKETAYGDEEESSLPCEQYLRIARVSVSCGRSLEDSRRTRSVYNALDKSRGNRRREATLVRYRSREKSEEGTSGPRSIPSSQLTRNWSSRGVVRPKRRFTKHSSRPAPRRTTRNTIKGCIHNLLRVAVLQTNPCADAFVNSLR